MRDSLAPWCSPWTSNTSKKEITDCANNTELFTTLVATISKDNCERATYTKERNTEQSRAEQEDANYCKQDML
jgi:hypothetical protein